ncbi:hypothetical protein L596_024696 [Steinernema carpocapsae]|uniref:Uncharacterized protein n=1 Tax=Steinernema carpocapsae TaxID=34508 RepID=A0A4U5M5H9_STECR|nr:hypothetical protein L596_024696 [Steinernema carpocapsae]
MSSHGSNAVPIAPEERCCCGCMDVKGATLGVSLFFVTYLWLPIAKALQSNKEFAQPLIVVSIALIPVVTAFISIWFLHTSVKCFKVLKSNPHMIVESEMD